MEAIDSLVTSGSACSYERRLTLAQTEKGLTCFVPRFQPNGQKNTLRIERLKDKLGNRSNASLNRV